MEPKLSKHPVEADELESVAAELAALRRQCEELRERCDRLLVHQELLDSRLLKIETNRLFRIWKKVILTSTQVLQRLPFAWLGARRGAQLRLESLDSYARWVSHEQSSLSNRSELPDERTGTCLISVVVVLRNWNAGTTEAGLRSLLNQTYSRFELCLACSPQTEVVAKDFFSRFDESSYQVRMAAVREEEAAPQAINSAASLAEGDYLVFFDGKDRLSPVALRAVADAVGHEAPDLIYSDEDQLDPAGRRRSPIFKPDWSPELLTSCMYLGNLLAVRRRLFADLGGLRAESEGAKYYDFALRLAEASGAIHHIPQVLYHCTPALDANHLEAEKRALEEAMERRGWSGSRAERCLATRTFSVRRPPPREALLSIIICSKNSLLLRRCLESIRASTAGIDCEVIVVNHTDGGAIGDLLSVVHAFDGKVVPYGGPFNFSVMNNLGARQATYPFLLFINDDVHFDSATWPEHLIGHLQRPEVGVVGATLRYPCGALQHAGIVLGVGDGVGHVGRFQTDSEWWPWLTLTRDVSAVTGAFLGIRADLFRELEGFDAAFAANYNDVDLCLRARAAGCSVVCMAEPGLIHEECQTREGLTQLHERELFYARWGRLLSATDPFYSPNLSETEQIALNRGEERPFDSLREDPWLKRVAERLR